MDKVMQKKQNDTQGYQFNLAIRNQVNSIIEPLKKLLPITNFAYVRIYDDNRLLHIQPNQELLEQLLENDFNNEGLKNEKLRQTVQKLRGTNQLIWPNDLQDEVSQTLYAFRLKNMTSMITKKDSYIESLTFSNSLDQKAGGNFNLKHKDVYKHFYYYFLNKIYDLVDFNDQDIYFKSSLSKYYSLAKKTPGTVDSS
jgi:hypothetical protein